MKRANLTLSDVNTIEEAARTLKRSWWWTRRAIKRGDLETVTLPGGRLGVLRQSVLELKAKLDGGQ